MSDIQNENKYIGSIWRPFSKGPYSLEDFYKELQYIKSATEGLTQDTSLGEYQVEICSSSFSQLEGFDIIQVMKKDRIVIIKELKRDKEHLVRSAATIDAKIKQIDLDLAMAELESKN